MRNLIILIIYFVIFTSCSTLTLTPKTQNINSSGILQLPVVAELQVKNEKITGESSQTSNTSLSIIKSNAVNNALSKSPGDVLIEPNYIIKTERGMTHVTVTGYPGIYKNFHTITEDDIPLIKSGDLHQLD